ncbi:MAG TPA: FAD-dependent monooxygenase [Longimicrobium sp.]|jgi:2-polyprenyl-6-methoxyphenol hydroxylase-like FAD-dependent oxidoreductase|uniref:FAD-dependent monooxygenase n=1 Tax=Longimicrobium sp. TaxID=2029185 RepID=UPI002EDB86DE
MSEKAIVVGGGIGGLSAAIALRQAGVPAQVYERAPALGEVGAGISLWPNATRQLARWGVLDRVLRHGQVIDRCEMRAADGALLSIVRMPAAEVPGVLIHRADLHAALLDALPPWAVSVGASFCRIREEDDRVQADFGPAGRAEGTLLVGADGLRSAVRGLLLADGAPVYRGYGVWRGVTAPGAVEWPALTETLGRGQRFGIVPIGGGRHTWWASANVPENEADPVEGRRERLLERFRGWHSPIPQLIAATPDGEVLRNATYDRPPVRRWGAGRVTLLGDAAHPTTPNLGQGGCMAIEDAAALAAALAGADQIPAALRRYERSRFRRTAFITRQSLWYGQFAQAEHAAAIGVRNAMFRLTPPSMTAFAFRRLFSYDAAR